MPETYSGPLPVPTPETREFWAAAKAHRLRIPYCGSCAEFFFYPRPFCPHCLGDDVSWRDVSGRARLVSFVIHHRPPRNFPLPAPVVIGIVELDEGPRMMSNIVEVEPSPESLTCDMPLEVVFDDVTDEVTLPRFRPASAERR